MPGEWLGSFLASGYTIGQKPNYVDHHDWNDPMKKNLTVALARWAAVLGMATTLPAQAAYVVINADPIYGSEFPGLGWRASGTLFVPDTCIGVIGALSYAFDPLNVSLATIDPLCRSSRIQDVTLQFYNLETPLTNVEVLSVGTYLADSRPADRPTELTQRLLSFRFSSGELDGFRTSYSEPIRATDRLVGGGDHCFSLQFDSAGSSLRRYDWDSVGGRCGTVQTGGSEILAAMDWERRPTAWSATAPVVPVAPVVPTPVPAPATLTLAGLALVAAAASARRRLDR
jgi:hypothetical protein